MHVIMLMRALPVSHTRLRLHSPYHTDVPKRLSSVGSTEFGPFVEWLSKGNVDMSNVEIASFGDQGNGLKAKRALKVTNARQRACKCNTDQHM